MEICLCAEISAGSEHPKKIQFIISEKMTVLDIKLFMCFMGKE
jgi:hypothetical protein